MAGSGAVFIEVDDRARAARGAAVRCRVSARVTVQADGLVVEQASGSRSDLAGALVGAGLRLETIMPTQRLEEAFLDLLDDGAATAAATRADADSVRGGPPVIALLRTEFVKAAIRMRTLVVAVLLVGLPTLIVVAIKSRGNRPDRGQNGEGLFRLAQQSGLLVPAAVLGVASAFLLVVIAGLLAGDSVASDSAWGNLRYVLMRPVSRTRAPARQGSGRRAPHLGVRGPGGPHRSRRRRHRLRRRIR